MDSFHLDVAYAADPKKVYDALTQEAGLKGWWTTDCEADPREGTVSTFRFGKTYNKVRVDRLVPGTEVGWTCVEQHHHSPDRLSRPDEWVGTKMAFRLSRNASDGTDLDFTHEGLTKQLDCYEICEKGWTHFLTVSLKQLLETGKGQPYQAEV